MLWTVLHLLILVTLSILSLAEDEHEVIVSCPDHQKAFGGSCYEFVRLQRSFFSAQAWCEQSGGHLAFIPNEQTQYFLQRHLDHDMDAWFGVAPSGSKSLHYSPTAEGPLSWLDGSCITYSNWVNSPQPGAACGYILRHSGFKWEATKDCNKRLPFICQFESGSSIVCAGHHTTLQCGSGQVVMIDGGFYGRKNIHYCRATLSPPTTSKQHQCGWVDVVETLTALCHGRHTCQVADIVNSFGEPCPDLGSYLFVDYQCKDGLTLTMSTVAAVFNDITITIKWLLDLSWGNVKCKLSTGDDNVFYLDSPMGLESSVVHKYTQPNTFVVTVKCTSMDIHITAEKIITIQEPITEISVIKCYAGNLFFHVTNCKTLYGRPFQIQMEVNAGTNVTYKIQSNKMLLSSLSVARGSVPHNITVVPEMVKQLRPGCHQLKLYVSNMVTFPEVSAELQVCVLEKVAGLQASILTERNDCLDSHIIVGVSLEEGAPVLLLFSLKGDNNSSFYETREMTKRKEIFQIGHQIEGTVQVKLRAWNVFSSLEVDMLSSCGKDSVVKLNGHNQLSVTKRPRKKHNRVVKSLSDIIATPSNSVPTRNTSITLSTSSPSGLNDNSKHYQWSCKNPCKCQGRYNGLTHTITEGCLPNPSEYNKYYFEVINKSDKTVENSKSICIILTPKLNVPDWLSLTCTQGCDPVNENTDAVFKLDCKGNEQCKQVVWNIEDLNEEDWPDETKSCYREAGKRPLIVTQNGGSELTVSQTYLKMAKSKNQDVMVVIYSGDVVPLYTTYTIKASSSTKNPNVTPTTKQPVVTAMTTIAESTERKRNRNHRAPPNDQGPNPDPTPKQPDATDKTTKGGNNDGGKNPARPANTPGTPPIENQGPNPAPTPKQPDASDKTTKGGNNDGGKNPARPANTPGTPPTENQGPNADPTPKQPADKTTKGGNSEGENNPARPANTPGTPPTENQGPNPDPTPKQPPDKTTKGGNSEGENNPARPANTPGTPPTENQGPNPAPTPKQPDASDKTTQGGNNDGGKNPARPANTPGTPPIENQGPNPAPTPKQPDASDKTTKGGNNDGGKNPARPANTPGTPPIENQGPNPAPTPKQPDASEKTTQGGNHDGGKNNPARPANTPGTPPTENQGPNPAPTPKQPNASDKTTEGGNNDGGKNPARPANTPGTPPTENQGPNPAPTPKQPDASDKTTQGGNNDGGKNPARPANTPGTPPTENQGPNPAPTPKQPDASDKTTKGGNNDGGKNPARPANTPGTPPTENQGPNPAPTPKQPDASDKTTKGGNNDGGKNPARPANTPGTPTTENQGPNADPTPKQPADKTTKGGNSEGEKNPARPSNTYGSSVDALKASVESAVDQLKNQGLLSGGTVGQLLISVSSTLNSQSEELEKGDRQKFREQMLDILIDAVNKAPPNTPDDVQVIAGGLSAIVQKGTKLSYSAQEQASLLLVELSSSLVHMSVNNSKENKNAIINATSTIMEGASNILEYSSNKNVSDALLNALYNIQSALLAFKSANEGPTIIQQANIAVFVKRVHPGSLHTESISITNCSCPAFSLPALPSKMFNSEDPVDIRMLSLNKNPFSWNERGNISGPTGGLSLTTTDGSGIPVENLTENIEILLPRPAEEQVNISVLDLGNYSTTIIDVPSTNNTLLLKMVPSKDPLPFKVFLGYNVYPTETSYVAMTEMPYEGTTLEERYTWLLDPETLKGNTGPHYLVVRPIVGPGIKSINASLSITSISAACKFWDESLLDWRTYGCKVGVKTSNLVTQCLCNHLTFFGNSFFVTPNLVDPSRSAELFGTFTQNPVVVCFVGAIFVAYLLVVVWARRKDVKDMAKVKVTFLDDNDPMDEYRYLLTVSTGHRRGGSTSSQVTVTLLGSEGNSEPHHLTDPETRVFERGAVDLFLLTAPFSLGELHTIRLWHNNSGSHPAWFVGNVVVQDLQTDQKWHFLCNTWLAIDVGDCLLDKFFTVSTEVDLKRFSNLFFMKVSKDFSDGHIWYSVINRPPSSTFTCVQRVSCCFSLLLCTMLTSIMFYGIPTDPSEQVMELGNFEFTWQQFVVGVQSSLIMFPVNFLIVGIFRHTRPREVSCCKRKAENAGALEQESTSQMSSSQTAPTNKNVTLDIIINDITRIARLLSNNAKSNIPCQVGPGQQVDISDVLSVVEDFIKQNNKINENAQSKTKSFCNVIQPPMPDSNASVYCGSTVDGIQRKSNKTQYLYRQLCHIHKQLSLLGPSGFPTPHSYNQALQQVQRMKGFLEDQILTSSSVNLDEPTQKKLSPADSSDGDGSLKTRVCCHGGLPWWFIFVGWLLVIATSFVAGYFTMIYGLKFGKQRSIGWLVSMMVSFFQSILIIQPLKVICLAVFFALLIKKVDEDEFQNVTFVRNGTNQEDCNKQQTVRHNKTVYEPPASADIEKMKKIMIMEQKAFALFREILAYMVFLSMLLVVVYTLRDPNAFYLNQHILNSFTGQISDSIGDVFTWGNTCLLNSLFGVHPGFITDGNSKLLGNARLRQLRVKKNSCQIASPMLQFALDCQAPYSWEVEDMGSYDAGWNHSTTNNMSTNTFGPWSYQTWAQLRASDIWGKLALYRGGGFVAELGPDLQNASSTLEYLFNNGWLDTYTRAIFVEFTVFNANVNLFCIVTLLLETPAIGAFQFSSELHSVRLYQTDDGLFFFTIAAEITYLLFILYYMFMQGKLMKQHRWAYFRTKWNLLELAIILLSWAAVAVYIKMTLLGNRNMAYYQSHKDEFASFYDTAATDAVLQYLIAFLILLSTVKLWHLLRLNPKMYMITATLHRASNDILSFLVVIGILFLAYSIVSNIIYGWKLSSYRTLRDAFLTLFKLQISIFNYDEVLDNNPLLGALIFGSCIVLITFVVLNLLIAVILVAFNHEKIHHKPSEEEEAVDLMLKKICSLFGITYKEKKTPCGLI